MTERHPNEVRGGSFYDDADVLEAYLNHRHAAVSSPNLVMEDPAFRSEVGSLEGLDVLDLGCGDGTFGAVCVAENCTTYVGVDGSSLMISKARDAIVSNRGRFVLDDIEDYTPEHSFDLIVSRMAFHYVQDMGPVIRRAHQATRPEGRLIFTVVHPIVTAGNAEPNGPRTNQVVNDYFRTGERQRQWFGKPVQWQHRTVENYVSAVLGAGYRLDALRECAPVESLFVGNELEYERRREVPLFLLISATRP